MEAYMILKVVWWVRPPGFEYRSKLPSLAWRGVWDFTLLISGLVPMLVFGAAIGNVLQGCHSTSTGG